MTKAERRPCRVMVWNRNPHQSENVPCRLPAISERGYCHVHDPIRQRERRRRKAAKVSPA